MPVLILVGDPLAVGRGYALPAQHLTVDSICPPEAYRNFIEDSDLFPGADVSLGLTRFIDDEKPLRVAMRGAEGTASCRSA